MDIIIDRVNIQDNRGVQLSTGEASIGDMIEIGIALLVLAHKRAKAEDKAGIVELIQKFEVGENGALLGTERGVNP